MLSVLLIISIVLWTIAFYFTIVFYLYYMFILCCTPQFSYCISDHILVIVPPWQKNLIDIVYHDIFVTPMVFCKGAIPILRKINILEDTMEFCQHKLIVVVRNSHPKYSCNLAFILTTCDFYPFQALLLHSSLQYRIAIWSQ